MNIAYRTLIFSCFIDCLRKGCVSIKDARPVEKIMPLLVIMLALFFGMVPQSAFSAPLVKGLGGSSDFGQLAMGRNDDGSSGIISLGSDFPSGIKLVSASYSNLYINNNGNITFRSALGTYTPIPFPVTNVPMLAAFWGDVDTRGGLADPLFNNVYYSTALAGKFVVTWNYVGYYSAQINKLNGFQIIITNRSDVGEGDFDLEYRYEQLQWTTGGASGGSNGLGGTPAQMGFDAGDGKTYYRHPDSATADILKLVETSNVGQPGIWRFEIRNGVFTPVKTPKLVNVRLTETLNTSNIDVDVTSFQVPPYGVSSANGQTMVEWRFDDFPANLTKDLSFDVIFKNPIPGESRLVVSKLELLYNDVNGNPVRTELGSEYVNVYPSIYQITPATDKAVYGPNEVVHITSTMKNLSTFPGAAALRLSVQSAGNLPVTALGVIPAQTVVASGTGTFTGLNFLTGNTYVGNYKVLAELLDNNGKILAFGLAPFAIAVASGQSVKATITTDKQVYNPLDRVLVSERITNLLSNATLDDARAITTVTGADGSVRFTRTETLLQLTPGGSKDYAYTLPNTMAAAGQYMAVLTVTKADGTLLTRVSTPFSVASTADTGAGLAGRISATPRIAHNGQSIGFAFSATNNGNSAIASLPLTVRIVDPDKQKVVKEFAYTTPLAVSGVFSQTANWVASVSAGGNFVAVLEASVAGRQQVLAQAPFTVLKLGITQAVSNPARVLVLVSCKNPDAGDQGKDADERASSKPEEEQAEDQDQSGTCVSDRANTIRQTLTALSVSHTVVTSTTEFKRAFRSGLYNTYWISGKQYKLHDALASELREAVFGGDRLILDGVHDERNKVLDDVAGITYRGKLGEQGLPVDTSGALFTTQRLATVGRALKLLTNGGQSVAAFAGTGPNATGPAILTNAYGQGRSIMFSFDLVSSLRAQALWQPMLQTSLQYLLPAQSTALTPGALLPVNTTVANQGPATGVQVSIALPAAAAVLGSNPTTTVDSGANTVGWAFDLAAEQTRELLLTLRVPPAAGDYALQTRVSTASGGTASLYGQPLSLGFTVIPAAQSYSDARTALLALPLGSKKAQQARDKLLEDFKQAMAAFNLNTAKGYEDSIAKLAKLADGLSALLPADTAAVRLSVDRILKEAQWRWSLLPAPAQP